MAIMKKTFLSLGMVLVLGLFSCKKDSTAPNPVPSPNSPSTPADNDHILLGNPTNAQASAASGSNYLKDNIYYKVGYNSGRGIPTWVSWHLQSSDIGLAARSDDFRPDVLPASWYAVTSASYSNSGFDRGHNCPSGDRTSSSAANSATFLMTNIIPQAPMLNQGPWEGLEDYIRNTIVGSSREAYIVMGNYGIGGVGSFGAATLIDNGFVTVPAKVWKVVVALPKGDNDLARLDTSAIVLAVNMPNNTQLYSTSGTGKSAWRNYLTTISTLETEAAASGLTLDLLNAVPASVRHYLKAKRFY